MPEERVSLGSEAAVRLVNVTKRFPGVVANDAISLEIRPAEVLCLLGENGAGKSTLISMLAGMQQPDDGYIDVVGQRVEISSPKRAMELGIGVVYQHSILIPGMSVLENIMLGEGQRFLLGRDAAVARLSELSESLGVQLDPGVLVRDLGLGQRQQVEIAKAIWRGSRVLILDEPTSMLTPQAITDLTRTVASLRDRGLAVVLITHKLREAFEMGDRIAVLRSGRKVAEFGPQQLAGHQTVSPRELVLEAMFGGSSELTDDAVEAAGAVTPAGIHAARSDGPVVLQLVDVSTAGGGSETDVTGIDLEVRAGEIIGVAGIDGHGQRALAEVIAGQRRAAGGRIELDGRDMTRRGVRSRQRRGLRYVTDDRMHEGIVGALSVGLNLVLKRIGQRPYWRFGFVETARVARHAEQLVAQYEIRTPSPFTRAGTLSGGNIQKLLLARELEGEPRAVVFHKPTYGLDLKTVQRVREAMRGHAASGGAALLISTDLDELVELASRIAVLSRGRIAGTVSTDAPGAAQRAGELMTGPVREGGNHG